MSCPRSFFITSVPKSGTHLLAKVIESVTGKYPLSVRKKDLAKIGHDYSQYCLPNSLVGHYRINDIQNNKSLRSLVQERKIIILIRDPRDVCNSMLHYLESNKNIYFQELAASICSLSFSDKIKAVASGLISADGEFKVNSLNKHCSGFVEIQEIIPDAILIKYEDFFDENLILGKLHELFNIEKKQLKKDLQHSMSSETKTKRSGKPNSWKYNFDNDLIKYMNEKYKDIILELGYEI